MSDRRHIERFKIIVPARLIVFESGKKKEIFETNTCNISSEGAFFNTEQRLPDGTQVELGFVLPVSKVKEITGVSSYVKITGKVVRSELDGIAVSFDEHYELMPFRNL